jgi:hypothetical protein
MAFKIVAPIAAVCMLAGCTTSGTGGVTPAARVDTWQGLDVQAMIPPLDLVAAANNARSQGRVLTGPRREGGAYVLTPADQLVAACANSINADAGPLVGCTVRNGGPPSAWTYTVYVSDQYPVWFRELVGTREFGHVGQSEFGLPVGHAGFTSPTADLIRRLGG